MSRRPSQTALPESLYEAKDMTHSKIDPKLESPNVAQRSEGDTSGEAPLDRRLFLGQAAGVGAAGVLFGAGSAAQQARSDSGSSALLPHCDNDALGPENPRKRRSHSFRVRLEAAKQQFHEPLPCHDRNDDEALYADQRGSYSKCLPHNSIGEVDPVAYAALLHALETGDNDDFEAVPMGNPAGGVVPPTVTPMHRMVNPQSGLGFDTEGADSHHLAQPPAPAFASAWEAGEIVENYWMAHLRDIPFTDYATHPLAAAALADINALSDFRGPTNGGGVVTAQELFRDSFVGCTVGPYVSQFFWTPQPFGAQDIDPRHHTAAPGIDYLIDQPTWLARQRGFLPASGDVILPGKVFMRNGRDLGAWVHIDVLFQAYFQACLSVLSMGLPANPGNPYNTSATQVGFGTLSGPYFVATLCEVATRALKAVWFQKWFVHRRLRPEAFGGRIHVHLTGQKLYDIHSDALNSAAVAQAFSNNGTYFCPMAFPEGSPAHPAYGAGHATVAGACVTILKALKDTQVPFPVPPVVALVDGSGLVPYAGPDAGAITVEGELNKIASNVATGRNIAGVHWRSDGTESVLLGEAVAISVLRDHKLMFHEDVQFIFRKFDGTPVTI